MEIVIKSGSKPALENVLGMKGGDGDSSYAKSSSMQLNTLQSVRLILERGICENIRHSMSNMEGIFRIADFGCGTGKNTLLVADSVVSAVQRSLHEEEEEMPEFEVYFIDLPSNDFNSLFRILPPHREEGSAVVDKNPLSGRSYTAAAVCGSHFRRLVPRKSLHFCHSSSSLHWLSQVPESVQQRSSPRAYISSDCGEGVAAAYLQQFDADLTAFLKARGEEMVDGGCMFISMYGRNAGTQIEQEQGLLGFAARLLEYAFEELVNEGIIEKEKWEAFDIPYYGANVEEVESIVKKEGSFMIEFVRTIRDIPQFPLTHVQRGEENMFGMLVANNCKAVFESIIQAHLGCERLTQEFFSRISKRASIFGEEYLSQKIEVVVAFLTKK